MSNIDWSVDGKLICAAFKVENLVVVWNIVSCKKVFEFKGTDTNFGNINNAQFYSLNPDYILICGDKAIMHQISTKKQVNVADNSQTMQNEKTQTLIKRKGVSNKQSTYLMKTIFHEGHRFFLLFDNQLKMIYLLGDKKTTKSSPCPQKVS